MREATYYVQFASDDNPGRWHTIVCVRDRELAGEIARLTETLFMRLETRPARVGRVVSRSALRREGGLHHVDWELGFGVHRDYGEALRKKAERTLHARAGETPARSSASTG